MRKLLTALLAAALAFGVTASVASAHETPAPKCSGETWAVVSAEGDAAMAELVAWHLSTRCIVEPDDAEDRISRSQQTVVLGGTAAVPDSAVDGLNVIKRLQGADRFATANAVVVWIRLRLPAANGKLATVGSGSERAAEATFVVGRDIRAGTWQFSSSTDVRYPGLDISSRRLHGHSCTDAFGAGFRIELDGFTHRSIAFIGHSDNERRIDQYSTGRFELRDGEVVTLRHRSGNKRPCEIVWVSD